ncbi:MAG: hypothetical protein COB15_01420 [Flavobacteriales bacterium]|nr:MAG: hypothetical protein COB15_01420 [Flavobacteriales bacterium]
MAIIKSETGKRELPRFYMELAIKAMKDSIDEKNKNNPSPRVGAVLVFPNGDYDTACRGELREGDHAEYTLLDKKYRTDDLTGCWIFATLEPCGPGARNKPKLPCSERIANARIEKVWYGLQELNSNASGGNEYLEGMQVETNPFDSDLHNELHTINKKFEDWVEVENTKTKIVGSTSNGSLNFALSNTNFSLLSKDALKYYVSKTKKEYSWDSDNLRTDLINKNLLEVNKETQEVEPTGNCLLLFGDNPRDKFPQASVKAKVDYGNGKEPDVQSFDGALVLIPKQIEDWVRKVLPESMDRSEFSREKKSNFPPEVIREVVINALVHRNYDLDGAKIQIDITPDKIEVRSPGEPFAPNTLSDLQNFTAISYARNKQIAYVFNLMRLMEESGLGMDTFKSMRKNHDLPLPEISYKKPNLVVAFPRTFDVIKKVSKNKALVKLNDEELSGYQWIRENGEVSKKEYAEHFEFDDKKALRHLNKMKKEGLMGDNGKPATSPNYKYVINSDD